MTGLNNTICSKCGATWIGGQLYWSTGKPGCPHDLAGLVCNTLETNQCINPCRGSTSGVTWEQRRHYGPTYK